LASGGNSPTARQDAAATFDLFRGRFVMFGGARPGQVFDDVWEWDGASWSGPAVAVRPAARTDAAMAFEVHTGRTILFGGQGALSAYFNDTWAWDGSAWTQLNPANSPSPRADGRLVYDSRRGRLVYFGGHDANGVLGETWVFDGQDWSRITTATVPNGGGTFDHGMVYDQARDRIVVFGGTADGMTRFATTWEFDGVDWVARQPASPPGARLGAAMAWVPTSQKTFLYGGSSPGVWSDTWSYQTDALAEFRSVGAGCPGSFGTAALSMPELPWIGTDFVLEVERVPASAATVILAGFQTASLPLDAIGAPGCVVTADPLATAVLPISPVTGLPTLTIPIPAVAGLLGGTLHTQAVIYEPAGAGRLSVSPRGDAVFGAL
jgi:hypothetical protein